MRFLIILCVALVPVMAQVNMAQAKTPLKDIESVREGMLTIGMADIIRRQCDDISPRMLRAYRHIKSLERHAQKLGYSDAEIEAYTDDDVEKQRLIEIAKTRLIEKGVALSDPLTYCTVGRAEIAAKTPIGKLLRAK